MADASAVLVTGASSGIGAACALRLDAAGMRVFAGVRRDSDAAALASRSSSRLTPLRHARGQPVGPMAVTHAYGRAASDSSTLASRPPTGRSRCGSLSTLTRASGRA